MLENDPLIFLLKAKVTMIDATGFSLSQHLVRVVLKTLGYIRKKVVVQAWPSSREIATTAFLEVSDRYEAEERRFGFPVDATSFGGTERSIYGYLRMWSPLCVRSSSKRTRISWSLLAAVDSFGDLSFARREGAYSSTLFSESLKDFP